MCRPTGGSFLSPHVPRRALGGWSDRHAEWTGVPLRRVLETGGVSPVPSSTLHRRRPRQRGGPPRAECHSPAASPLANRPSTRHAASLCALTATCLSLATAFSPSGCLCRLVGVASVKCPVERTSPDRPFPGYFQSTSTTVQAPQPTKGTGTFEFMGPRPLLSVRHEGTETSWWGRWPLKFGRYVPSKRRRARLGTTGCFGSPGRREAWRLSK